MQFRLTNSQRYLVNAKPDTNPVEHIERMRVDLCNLVV